MTTLIISTKDRPVHDNVEKLDYDSAKVSFSQHDDGFGIWLKLKTGNFIYERISWDYFNLEHNIDGNHHNHTDKEITQAFNDLKINRERIQEYVNSRSDLYHRHRPIGLINWQYDEKKTDEWQHIRDNKHAVKALGELEEKYLQKQMLTSYDFLKCYNYILDNSKRYNCFNRDPDYQKTLNVILNRLNYLANNPSEAKSYELFFKEPNTLSSERIYDKKAFSKTEANANLSIFSNIFSNIFGTITERPSQVKIIEVENKDALKMSKT